MKYSKPIDGLRSLAIVPVVLYHADLAFSAGFLGVDVFFVISGYLITRSLYDQMETGRFSLLDFYERRARRIIPALTCVLLVCCVTAWLILNDSSFRAFNQSLVATSTFLSNLYFWKTTDYFSLRSEMIPLLHTWSLAIEEQFYIFQPLIMYGVYRFRRQWLLPVFVLLTVISFLLIIGWFDEKTDTIFYSIQYRAWELMVGAIVAVLMISRGVSYEKVQRPEIPYLGVLLVMLPMILLEKSTQTPGYTTLMPVLGTGMLLLNSGNETHPVNRFLSNPIAVGIGLISYSLYLWHQPIFVFARHIYLEMTIWVVGASIALSTILSYFSWRYVETPFRSRQRVSRRMIFSFSIISLCCFMGFGLIGHITYGYSDFRERERLLSYTDDNKLLQRESWRTLRNLAGNSGYGVENNLFDRKLWFKEPRRRNVLLVGNSHSKDLWNSLMMSSYVEENEFARFGCQLTDLRDSHAFWLSENYLAAEVIVLVTRFQRSGQDSANLKDIIDKLLLDKKRVVLVKNTVEFPEYRYRTWTLADKLVHEAIITASDVDEEFVEMVSKKHYEMRSSSKRVEFISDVNRDLEQIAVKYSLPLLDRTKYMMDPDEEVFPMVDRELNKYFYDYGHITLMGAKFHGQRISELAWFDFD